MSLAAARSARKSKYGFETRPTVSNMLLMCQENPTFAGVKSACHNRYSKSTDQKKKKFSYAENILKQTETAAEVLEDFCRKYEIENFKFDMEEVKKLYLDSYLKQLKYNFRQAEQRKRSGENE